MLPRKTKIVCTLGPTADGPAVLAALLQAGMNVARLNMAHGDKAEHAARIARLREASRETGVPVAILIDIKGPEIRTGEVAGGGTVTLAVGSAVTVSVDGSPCTAERISVSYRDLPAQMSPGKHILVADGLVDLEVTGVEGELTRCVVRSGGTIGSHKNVNLVGVRTRLPAVTERDVEHIGFAVAEGLDFVAASFVRKSGDVLEIRKLLAERGSSMHIVSKIEDEEGLENIDGIIRVSDGVMVARGDLGVQLPTEQIPLVQKRIIASCHEQNKVVITATQMLDSMIVNPRPTRAEATDVANAIFDGTDAVMLSGETANGAHPVLAVQTMDRIARAAEGSPEYEARVRRSLRMEDAGEDAALAVARSAYLVARDVKATAILTPTLRGNTPRLISKFRPCQTILAVTPSEEVRRRLLLAWGVVPIIGELVGDTDAMINNALEAALSMGIIAMHDRVVTLAGVPVNSPAALNMIRIHFLGTVLARGRRGMGGWASGRIVKVTGVGEASLRLRHDGTEILLLPSLTSEALGLLRGLVGVLVEEPTALGDAELEAAAPGIVLVAAVPSAMRQLEDGLTVTLHGTELTVYEGSIRPR